MTNSNLYKRLGDYIETVNVRNRELKDIPLMGLSINKVFIPSIANTIGSNMANYKVIERDYFGYGPVTSRNGEKITIALFKDYDEALMSQAYTSFKITKPDELLSDYLMMWFSRPEFDRYARYHSHGSARETFDWDAMCEVELPVPSLEKQQKIVAEYQAVENKIKTNEAICEKLEASAQALYKHWFVDFEFPNEEGKPYRSSGGKMVWNDELEKEIPEGWRVGELQEIMDNFDSQRIPLSKSQRAEKKGEYPYYGAAALMDYVDDYIFDGTYILLGEDGTVVTEFGTPVLQYVWGRFWVNNHAHVLKAKNGFNENSLYILLKNTNITDKITGGVQAKINQRNLNSIQVLIPSLENIEKLNGYLESIFELYKIRISENDNLRQFQELLLSRMVKEK